MSISDPKTPEASGTEPSSIADSAKDTHPSDSKNDGPPKEIGGREGLDPVRYGDWEKGGRCIDF